MGLSVNFSQEMIDVNQLLCETSLLLKKGRCLSAENILLLTLFRMGGQKNPPTSFSPVTPTNVEISPQKFLTFSFNPFATLM